MAFQQIRPIEKVDTMLDHIFLRARKKTSERTFSGDYLQRLRSRELFRLDIVSDKIDSILERVLQDFPAPENLNEFYYELARLQLDLDMYARSLRKIEHARNILTQVRRECARNITQSDLGNVKRTGGQYYGRISSVLERHKQFFAYLEKSRHIFRTWPTIKEMYTVVLYGFPNVGKSTLLNTLTGADAKTAGYAFTTQGINSGFMHVNDKKVQVLDVPGHLGRARSNSIEEIADLSVELLANTIIYVFDLTEPYPLSEQIKLYEKVSKHKDVYAIVSKQDLVNSHDVPGVKIYTIESILELIGEQ